VIVGGCGREEDDGGAKGEVVMVVSPRDYEMGREGGRREGFGLCAGRSYVAMMG
jgi:hypothetical protein